MRTLSITPTTPFIGTPPRQRSGLAARARQVAVDLTPQAVEQVAARVAQLLHLQQQNQEQDQPRDPVGMLTVSQLANHLHLNRAWVYEHADELGAIRIGSGPKARIRFDFHTATDALKQQRASRTPTLAPVKPLKSRRRRTPASVPLLPVHDRQMRGVFARCRPLHQKGR
jgi:hypothetical protein